jgi:dTDP-4-amino-4,6-dideoxygalactose transaminase
MKIPFTNLHQQYLDCKSEIDQAIADTIASSSFITGPDVTKFEQVMAQYIGVQDCASTGSGTTGLLCAMRALGIGPGDEILTTPHTFVATTEAIVSVGATPIFVDIDPDTHLIDLDLLELKITSRTRAIAFVDMYGQCPDLDRINDIARKHNLVTLEDAAHSLGTTWKGKLVGSQADITCFSFNPVKNLGAMGDAGCVTGSRQFMDRVRMYRDHGRVGRYDIIELGYNARIDNMQSSIVMAKLPKLTEWVARKKQIVTYYNQRLGRIVKTIKSDSRAESGHYVYVIQTELRDQLKHHLEQRGISTNIHYATTTHQQPAFQQWYTPCPVAEKTVKEILSLPSWYSMTQEQIEYVADSVEEFFK